MQTIMIVEDDPVIREELTFLLENESYQVLPVSDFETVPGQVRIQIQSTEWRGTCVTLTFPAEVKLAKM